MVQSRLRRAIAASAICGGALAGLALPVAPPWAMAGEVVAPGAAGPWVGLWAGSWSERVQVIHDAAAGTVVRVRLKAWNAEPVDALEFVFEPEPGSGFDPSAGGGAITGRGKLVWRVRGSASYDRRTIYSTYAGDLVAGRPHGNGRMEKRSGEVLEGEWAGGLLHGKGTLTEADGTRTQATFVEGRAHGEGRQTTPDGTIYEGGFRAGLRHGEARVRLPGGTAYVSRWLAGVEVSSARPDAMADAMVGGLLRAQSGGGDAGKAELSVSVDQRMTRQADMRYEDAVFDDRIEIYPADQAMIETWLGKAMIDPYSYGATFGYVDWEAAPAYLQVGLKTVDGSRVRLNALQLQVEDSQVYRKPFLSIIDHRGCVGFRPDFSFGNTGWGPVRDARLSVEFFDDSEDDGSGRASRAFEVPVGDFDAGIDVSLRAVLEEAGVDTRALERARFTCASEQELPACRQRAIGSLEFGEIGDLLTGGPDISVGIRGTVAYSWADDRGNSHDVSEPFVAALQLGAIETEIMIAEGGAGWGDPPAALRYQEVDLPSDAQNYVVDLTMRGNRNVSDVTARLKVSAQESSIHRFRAVASFADGSARQTKPVVFYHLRPRAPAHVPAEPAVECYLDDAVFAAQD